jgi:periplasmic protein TonB
MWSIDGRDALCAANVAGWALAGRVTFGEMCYRGLSLICAWLFGAALSAQVDTLGRSSDKAQGLFDGGFRSTPPPVEDAPSRSDGHLLVEEQPAFPGGEEERLAFLQREQHYPDSALALGVKGKVYIGFVVEADGRLNDVRVLRGVHPLLDAEALRMVNAMPPWTPAKRKGKPVRVQFVLPITFQLR